MNTDSLVASCRMIAAALDLMAGLLAAPARAGAGESFDVLEYRVGGNSLLDAAAIERAVYPHLGAGRQLADVEAARADLEVAYRGAGFPTVLVDIPEQDVAQGVVRLKVTEGKVERLVITGARYFENGRIREQMPELAPGNVPRLAEFQSELRAVNLRSPDRSVTPVLRPGHAPGTVEAELKVADSLPLHAAAEVNNRSTADTSESRLNLSASYGNLWQREQTLSLQYQVAPENAAETEVWAASYAWKPTGWDKSLVFFGVKSDSDVATVSDIAVIGNGKLVGAQLLWPLPAGPDFYHSAVLGVTWKDFEEVIGFDAADQADIETPIKYVNWSAGYNATLVGDKRTHAFALTGNFGIRGIGNDANQTEQGGTVISGEFEDKRSGAQPNYFYLNGSYDLRQELANDASLLFRLSGQVSPEPLVSNEQFSAGGADSVRGYYEAEVLGDYGVQTTLEWQSANFGPRLWRLLDSVRGLAFTDFARLGVDQPQPEQQDRFTLWSAGLGLRLSANSFTGALDWAWPLHDGTSTSAGDDRVLFRFRYGF